MTNKYYSVTVNGQQWYYGSSAKSAMEHVIKAGETGEQAIAALVTAPKSGLKVQCCAGIAFHASDCPFVEYGY